MRFFAGYVRGMGVISAMDYMFVSPRLLFDMPRVHLFALPNTAIPVIPALFERRLLQ